MDLRKERAVQIFKNSESIKPIDDGWAVRSQNSKRYYYVNNQYNCNCPDCQFNGTKVCKHSYAVKYFLGIEKPDGSTTKIRLSYPQAWKAYTQAQNSEIKEFDELLKDLLEDIEEPEYTFGRPKLSKKELLFCSIQKVYSQLSSRRAYSLFKNAENKQFLKKAPNYNAVNKFLNNKNLTKDLKNLIQITALPLKTVETKFAIDSSGFRTNNFNQYCQEKHGKSRRNHWLKAHITVGTKTNIVCSAKI